MQIGYVTTDPMNASLARPFARSVGATVVDLWPGESPGQIANLDGLVVDLDHLDGARDDVLASLAQAIIARAVHSYTGDEDDLNTLRRQGVAIHQRLDVGVFASLLRAGASKAA